VRQIIRIKQLLIVVFDVFSPFFAFPAMLGLEKLIMDGGSSDLVLPDLA
jgi:hypothetical protein